MKNILIALALLCTVAPSVSAQNTEPHCLIKMDMCTPDAPFEINHSVTGRKNIPCKINRRSINYKETTSFEAFNINPFRYKVEVDGQGVSMHTDTGSFRSMIKNMNEQGLLELDPKKLNEPHTLIELFISFPAEVDSFPVKMGRMDCYNNSDLNKLIMDYQALIEWFSSAKIAGDHIPAEVKDFVTISKDSTHYETTPKGQEKLADVEKKLSDYYFRSTTVSTLPLQIKGNNYDLIKYHVKRTNILDNKTEERDYEYYVVGGWKFDVSTGIIMSGLLDRIYYTKDSSLYQGNDTLSKKIIYQNSRNKFGILGLTALAHFSYRASPFFKFGICGGVAGTTDISLKYLLGGSLVFGSQNRFCLNGGIAMGKIKELDPALEVGGFYEGTSSTVPTIDVYHYSWFFGITYNLTKGNKSQDSKE